MTRLLQALNDALEAAETNSDFEPFLAALTRESGFDFYAYLGLGSRKIFARSNYPDAWQSDYLANSYFSIDPVVNTARRTMRPFRWSASNYQDQDQWARDFFSRAAAFDIRSGLSFPISIGFGGMAMLTVASRHDASTISLEIDPVFAAATVGHIHARLRVRGRASGKMLVKLKPQEVACLTWYAQGKSLRDIAIIEGMKYSNVCFHMSNARKKLDAGTSAQAAVNATRLKLIP
ncbi:autoinducer binding domain-containing protein [Neorhizobium galegae]|uniref:autoinducer binding domain-containing protein n=1 Tax=Neorhizobium galegae TaxID=399 RepID=UPI0006224E43|nr:autoinducer binding domain-containing protein [Neorhizobium galegae]MCQ1768146.1 autoinducer binding domain-containing protein [Neorhizobium galegae]MCQ1847118.1 autoinducer binding domain-containing protein [Neorhizobium galegae]CDZ29944.1 Autoinducer-binding transcriptional regulator, LuxR family [Neorhizobium galegae bv. officinalis]